MKHYISSTCKPKLLQYCFSILRKCITSVLQMNKSVWQMNKSITWVHVLHLDKIYYINVAVKLKCYCNISFTCEQKYCITVIYEHIFIIVTKYITYEQLYYLSVNNEKKYISVLDLQNYFIRQVLIRTKGITAVLQLTPLC